MSEEVEIERAIRLLVDPGSTFEVRALGKERGRPVTRAGYFVEPATAARMVSKLDAGGDMTAIYATLNPVRPELRARCADRLDVAEKGGTTGDQHIVKRTRLLIDVDGAPVSGVSASDDEHNAAIALAAEIAHDLGDRGWPEPLRGDSGNGAHLVYAIDLPVDCEDLVGRVLDAAQARWGCTTATGVTLKVDGKNRNPARITKLFGTVARKGDNLPERPHRRARILSAPEKLDVVSRELLEALAGEIAKPAPKASTATHPGLRTLDVGDWLTRHGIAVKSQSEWQGGTMYELEVCPVNADHDRGEAFVAQHASGAISAGCHHESCKHWDWSWLRDRHEPDRRAPWSPTATSSPTTHRAQVEPKRQEVRQPINEPQFNTDARFVPMPDRLRGEREQRVERGKRALSYHNAFLDDQLRAIATDDLVLFGAESGVGKTQFVTGVAQNLAKQGKRVRLFALEAGNGEIEQRIKYAVISQMASTRAVPGHDELSFPDWMLGRCDHITGCLEDEADREIATDYRTLHTFYRGNRFDGDEMRRRIIEVQEDADLIILDHLHYVDAHDDENENRSFKRNMQLLRNLTIGLGKPIFVVAHLRKSDRMAQRLVPTLEDFHGSGDIGKIATRAILLAPARGDDLVQAWHSSPTFCYVAKDRVGGHTGHVALLQFDRRYRTYGQSYTLGRLSPDGKKWAQLDITDNKPRWARHHVRISDAA